MALGYAYGQSNGNFVITQPSDTFGSNSPFAYVVILDQGIGTTQAQIIFVQEVGGGVESPVYSTNVTVSNPQDNEFANTISRLGDIFDIYANGPGTYKFEMSDGFSILASETFTYTG